MKRIFTQLLVFIYIFCINTAVFAQDVPPECEPQFTVKGENADCESNGRIIVTVAYTPLLQWETMEFGYVGQGGSPSASPEPNGGIFNNVQPGTYKVYVRAFCKLNNVWFNSTVMKTVTVTTNYKQPNMAVLTSDIKPSMCGSAGSGMIPVSFAGGKGPYTATMTGMSGTPPGYTCPYMGVPQIKTTAGTLQFINLPVGTYNFTLSDACGKSINGSGTVTLSSLDVPTTAFVLNSVTAAGTDCKTLTVSLKQLASTSPLYSVFTSVTQLKAGYDIVLTEMPSGKTSIGNITAANTSTITATVNLIDFNYESLYPTTSNTISVFFRTKDCTPPKSSPPTSITLTKPTASISAGTTSFSCTHANFTATSSGSFVCRPLTVNFYSTSNPTTPVLANQAVSANSLTVSLPFGTYFAEFVGAGGAKWTSGNATANAPTYTYTGNSYTHSYCYTDLKYAYIRVWETGGKNFPQGTKFEVISAPGGMSLPSYIVPQNINVSNWYPYGSNYEALVPGLYSIRVTDGCTGNVTNFNVNVAAFNYVNYHYGGVQTLTTCPPDGKYARIYVAVSSGYIPAGSTLTVISVPAGQAMPNPSTYTVPNASTGSWYPYGSNYEALMPGQYVIRASNTCNSSNPHNITITVPPLSSNIAYSSIYERLTNCPADGKYARIGVRLTSNGNILQGTTFEVINAPAGQSKPPKFTINDATTKAYYPYTTATTYESLLPGQYVIEAIDPCGGVKTLSINVQQSTAAYTTSTRSDYCITRTTVCAPVPNSNPVVIECKEVYSGSNLGKFYALIERSTTGNIPPNSVITYIGGTGPAGALKHTNVTIPAGYGSRFFNPFNANYSSQALDEVTPHPSGTYIFSVTDAGCGNTVNVTLTIPPIWRLTQPLSYTQNFAACVGGLGGGISVFPTGALTNNNTPPTTVAFYRIIEARDLSGNPMTSGYPTGWITTGGSFNINVNGYYVIGLFHNQNTGTCPSATTTVTYEQNLPKIDMDNTQAYACVGSSVGTIQISAKGGYGTGPYKFEFNDGSGSQSHIGNPITAPFSGGAPGSNLIFTITDQSPLVPTGCVPQTQQQIHVLNLQTAKIVYEIDAKIHCPGETVRLSCVTLGNTEYNWTGPNGYTSTEQHPVIHNIQSNQGGWYYVNVKPELCGTYVYDSVRVRVRTLAGAPVLANDVLEFCDGKPVPFDKQGFIGATGITIPPGYTPLWYFENGQPVPMPYPTYTGTLEQCKACHDSQWLLMYGNNPLNYLIGKYGEIVENCLYDHTDPMDFFGFEQCLKTQIDNTLLNNILNGYDYDYEHFMWDMIFFFEFIEDQKLYMQCVNVNYNCGTRPFYECLIGEYVDNICKCSYESNPFIHYNTYANRNFYVTLIDENGCEGPKTPFKVVKKTLPAPNLIGNNNLNNPVCFNGHVIVDIHNTNPSYNYIVRTDQEFCGTNYYCSLWDSDNYCGNLDTLKGNGASVRFEVWGIKNKETEVWIQTLDPNDGCKSAPSGIIYLMEDIYAYLPNKTLDAVCSGDTVTFDFEIGNSYGDLLWYDNTTVDAPLLHVGPTYTTVLENHSSLPVERIFYVGNRYNYWGCETSPQNRATFSITVKPAPFLYKFETGTEIKTHTIATGYVSNLYGNHSSYRLPFIADCPQVNCTSISQQIYTEAELAEAGLTPGSIINSLAFNYQMPVDLDAKNISIYLAQTTQEYFYYRDYFFYCDNLLPFSSLSEVFKGDLYFPGVTAPGLGYLNNYPPIPIKPFKYSGGSLVVAVASLDHTNLRLYRPFGTHDVLGNDNAWLLTNPQKFLYPYLKSAYYEDYFIDLSQPIYIDNNMHFGPEESGLSSRRNNIRFTSFTPKPVSICVGQTDTLTSTIPDGTWYSSDPEIATISSNGVVSGVGRGEVEITFMPYDDSYECFAVAIVTVTDLPEIPLTTDKICGNAPFQLPEMPEPGTWRSNKPGVATVDPHTGWVTITGNGTVTFTFTLESSGCEATTRPITIYNFNPGTIPNTTLNVCTGDNAARYIVATAPAGGGVEPISYQWYRNDVAIVGATQEFYQIPTIDRINTTEAPIVYQYVLKAKDSFCQTAFVPASGVYTMIVNPVPSGKLSYSGTFCITNNNQIFPTLSITPLGLPDGTYSSYPPYPDLDISTFTGAIRPSTSELGNYIVTYTVPAYGGCPAVPITTETPHVQIRDCINLEMTKTSNKTTACLGEDVTFTITVTNKETYTITNISVKDDWPVSLTHKSNLPGAGTTYNTGTTTWTIPGLAPEATVTLQLVGTAATAGINITNRAYISQINTVNFATFAAATVKAETTNLLTVYPAFNAGSIAGGTKEICSGSTEVIIVNNNVVATGGDGVIKYAWYKNGTLITGAAGASYTIPNGDKINTGTSPITITYTRRASDGACYPSLQNSSNSFTLTVIPAFNPGEIDVSESPFSVCQGDQTPITIGSISAAGGGKPAYSYQWYKGDAAIPLATGLTYNIPNSDRLTEGTILYRRFAIDTFCSVSMEPAVGTFTLIITSPSTADNIITRDTAICVNEEINLNDLVYATSNVNNPQFVWYTTSGGSNTVTPTVIPLQTTTYWAAVKGTNFCEGEANSTGRAKVTITVENCADTEFTISKNSDHTHYCVDDTVTFTVTLKNNFAVAATGIKVKELWPSQINYLSASPDIGSFNSATTTWDISSLDANTTATLILKGIVATTLFTIINVNNQVYLAEANGNVMGSNFGDATIKAELDTKITIYPALNPGAIGTGPSYNVVQNLCSGSTMDNYIGSFIPAGGGDGNVTYVWYKNDDPIPSSNSQQYQIPTTDYINTGSGTITLVYTRRAYDGFCNTTPVAASGTFTVHVHPIPAAPTIKTPVICNETPPGTGDVIILAPRGTGFEYRMGLSGSWQADTIFKNVTHGTHLVYVRSQQGCVSLPTTVVVDCPVCEIEPAVSFTSAATEAFGVNPVSATISVNGPSGIYATITHSGTGSLSTSIVYDGSTTINYTPSAADEGTTVTITATTNNPAGTPCEAATAYWYLTVLSDYITLDLTLFLQGVTQAGPIMTTYLQGPPRYDIIPDKALPKKNPFTNMPEYYSKINEVSGPAGKVVDWVLVEIMTNFESFTLDGIQYTYYDLLESRALLLKPDGSVVDTNGNKPQFQPYSDHKVRIAIKTRNHLSVISSELLDFDSDVKYDFSENVTKALKLSWASYPAMIEKNGVACLYGGDVWNGLPTDRTINIINAVDIDRYNTKILSVWNLGDYMFEDVNMDAMLDSGDGTYIITNARQIIQSPLLYYIKRP